MQRIGNTTVRVEMRDQLDAGESWTLGDAVLGLGRIGCMQNLENAVLDVTPWSLQGEIDRDDLI